MRWLLPALLLISPSCKPPAASEGRLAAIEANIASLRPLAGHDGDAAFTAYFQQSDLQLIDEQPMENSPVHRRYYFHQGALFYYRQLERQNIVKQFVVDKNGHVKNTVPAPFPGPEYAQITARSEELRSKAIARAGQVFDFPIMRTR